MFGKKKSSRSFSLMLAEEILRAELKIACGDGIKIFQIDTVAISSPFGVSSPTTLYTIEEVLTVEFKALVGPFGRLFPENPPEDRRRLLGRVKGVCKIIRTGGSALLWHPYYITFDVFDEHGLTKHEVSKFYKFGDSSDAPNPCQDMCDSQIPMHYPGIYPALHGINR